jgi:hypothetical protein
MYVKSELGFIPVVPAILISIIAGVHWFVINYLCYGSNVTPKQSLLELVTVLATWCDNSVLKPTQLLIWLFHLIYPIFSSNYTLCSTNVPLYMDISRQLLLFLLLLY